MDKAITVSRFVFERAWRTSSTLKTCTMLVISLVLLTACTPISRENAGQSVPPDPNALTLEDVANSSKWMGPLVWMAWWSADAQELYYKVGQQFAPDSVTYRFDRRTDETTQVANEDLGQLDGAEKRYDRERTRAVFVGDDGDLYMRRLDSGELTRLTETPEYESAPLFSADGSQVYFQQDNTPDWFAWNPDGASTPVLVLKTEEAPQAPAGDGAFAPTYLGDEVDIVSSSLAPDGRHAVVRTTPRGFDSGRVNLMPRYVTESGFVEVEEMSAPIASFTSPPQTLWLVDTQSREVRELDLAGLPGIAEDPLAEMRAAQGLPPQTGLRTFVLDFDTWNADGTRFVAGIQSVDHRDYWIIEVDPKSAEISLRHRETDPVHVQPLGPFGFLADDSLWFVSEQSGYASLYLDEGAGAKAIAAGKFEVSKVQWNRSGDQAYFVCNRAWPGDYEVCRVNRDGSDLREITALDGVGDSLHINTYELSPDDSQLAVFYSGAYLPVQLALVDAQSGATRKLTDTRSEELKAHTWVEPEFVEIPSTHFDGTIWGKLYRPAELEAGRTYPMVIILHGGSGVQAITVHQGVVGAGDLMFSNFLVQHGYIVLEIDFRGSAGYGRDFLNAIYREVGQVEVEDMRDSVDFLVANYQGDRENAGIMGASYGGFLAYMAMFLAPDVFKAGKAECGYSEWTMSQAASTGGNFLNTPDVDPEAYTNAAPLTHAGNLQGRLLIVHGMVDTDVYYQNAVLMVQRLIDLGKQNWEQAAYPNEDHCVSVQYESKLDKHRRVFALFEEALKAK